MTKVTLCRDCKHSVPEINSDWNLHCLKPEVMMNDIWVISNNSRLGASCLEERKKVWFAACGKAGKLWESRLDSSAE